jgi:hypothetical protein
MAKGAATLIINGLFLVFGGLMWDAGPGTAWNDMNNSITDVNSTAHAAVSAGQIEAWGFGTLIAALGILCIVGSVLMLVIEFGAGIGGGR